MIDLYFCGTPNGMKILIMMEEFGIECRLIHLNTLAGENFTPDFLKISPNAKIPAIVDHHPRGGSDPICVFESGAILLYVADKGDLIDRDPLSWATMLSWLFWQMASLGPVSGQRGHFAMHAPPEIDDYALSRFNRELNRLYAVLDQNLVGKPYICGEFSIADIAIYPWIHVHEMMGMYLRQYPQVSRWFDAMAVRPSVRRAYKRAEEYPLRWPKQIDDDQRRILFGCTADDMRRAYEGKIVPWSDKDDVAILDVG